MHRNQHPPTAAAKHATSSRLVEELLLAGVIAVVFGFVLLFAGVNTSLAIPLGVLFGITLERFVSLALRPREYDLFAPAIPVAAYFLVYFCLRSLYLSSASSAWSRLGRNSYDDYLPAALWCACLGYLCCLAGTRYRPHQRTLAWLAARRFSWPHSFSEVKLLVPIGLGACGLAYLFLKGLVVGNYDNPEFRRTPPPGLPILLEKLVLVSWIAVCVFLLLPGSVRNRKMVWPLAFVCLGLLAFKVAISGSKESLIEPLFALLIVFHYLKRRLRLWQLGVVALPVLVLAFGLLNFYRFVVVGNSGASPRSLSDVVSQVSNSSEYLNGTGHGSGQKSAFEQMMIRDAGVDALALVMKYTPELRYFVLGRDLLKVPLTFIPRQIWKGKPVNDVGAEFENIYMGMPVYYQGFSSIHLISDFYRNFWLFGVAGGMFLFGLLLRLLSIFCAPATRSGAGVFFYAALLPTTIHCLEVDAGSALTTTLRTCILLTTTALFLGMKRQSPRGVRSNSVSVAGRAYWAPGKTVSESVPAS